MAATTADALRTELLGFIAALVPVTIGADRFKVYDNQLLFREHAGKDIAGSFRTFDLYWERPQEPPLVTTGDIERWRYKFILEVAYPRLVYKTIRTARAMLRVIDEDQEQLIQVLRDRPTNAVWVRDMYDERVEIEGELAINVIEAGFEFPRDMT